TEQRYNAVSEVISTLSYGTSAKDISALSAAFNARTLTYTQLASQLNGTLVSDARVSHSVYNGSGQLTQITHADNNTESYTYYDNGLKATYTNQKGATWDYTYDNQGRLTEESGPEASYHYWDSGVLKSTSVGKMTKAMTYDDMGNVITLKEGIKVNGNWLSGAHTETTFGYDLAGRQTSITQPEAVNTPELTVTTQYNALGQAISNTRAGITTYKSYDNAGRIYRERDGEGYVTERTFDALGRETTLIRYANAGSYSNGEIAVVASNDDRRIDRQYRQGGQKVSVSQGEQYTEFTYNAFGEEIKKTQLVSGTWGKEDEKTIQAYTYFNALGQRSGHVDEAGYLTTYQYNEHGELAEQIEYAKAVTGAISESIQPTGLAGDDEVGHNREISFHYDNMGRLTHKVHHNVTVQTTGNKEFEYVDHNKVVEFKEYDALGKVRTQSTQSTNELTPESTQYDSKSYQLFEYDALGRLVTSAQEYVRNVTADATTLSSNSIATQLGREATTYKYDFFGNVVEHRVHATRLTGHDGTNGNITAPAEQSGDHVTRHHYNLRGLLVKEVNALGEMTSHAYDALGQLTETTKDYIEVAEQSNYQISYSQTTTIEGHQNTYTGEGLPTGFSFNSKTGVITNHREQTSNTGITSSITITIKDPRGVHIQPAHLRTQSVTFNETTLTRSINSWQATSEGGSKTHFTRYLYNNVGDVVQKSMGIDDVVEFNWHTNYNGFGEVTKDEHGAIFSYNSNGLIEKSTQGDGVLKTHHYDKAGRLREVVHALNGSTQYTRDNLGRAIEITHPDYAAQAVVTHQTYDRWDNIIVSVDAEQNTIKAQYNHRDQVTKEVLPQVMVVSESGTLTYERPENIFKYDATGNLVSKTDGNLNTTIYTFNLSGQQVGVQDALENIHRSYYDIFGRKVISKDAEARITTSTYDKLGQVTEAGQYGTIGSQSFSYRKINAYEYDGLGNRTHEVNALEGIKQYKYDSLGNVVFRKDEMNRIRTYENDKNGLQVKERFNQLYTSGLRDEVTRNFDSFGRLVSMNDLSGKTHTTTYFQATSLAEDGAEIIANSARVMGRTNEYGQDIHYTYYPNGWLHTVTDEATGAYSEFEYNRNGQRIVEVKQARDDLGRVMRHRTETQYDSHGRITFVTTNELKNISTTDVPNWVFERIISRVSYQYDAVGNRRKMQVENGLEDGLPEDAPSQFSGVFKISEMSSFTEMTGNVAQLFQSLNNNNLTFSGTFYKQTEPNSPEWFAVEPPVQLNQAGFFTGTPSFESEGVYLIDVIATDPASNKTYTAEVTLVIEDTPPPFTSINIGSTTLREGEAFDLNLTQYFEKRSPQTNVNYAVQGLPAGLTLDQNSERIVGSFGYESAGSYPVTITATHVGEPNYTVTESFTIRVLETLKIEVHEEREVTLDISQFMQGYNTPRLEVDDAARSFIDLTNNVITIAPEADHGKQSGYYAVTVLAKHNDNEKPPQNGNNQVTNPSLAIGEIEAEIVVYHVFIPDTLEPNIAISKKRDGNFTITETESFPSHVQDVTQYFNNPDNDTIVYTQVLQKWGSVPTGEKDSAGDPIYRPGWETINHTPGWLSFNSTSFSGTPGYSDSGTYRIMITAREQNRKVNHLAQAYVNFTVEDLAQPIRITEFDWINVYEGQRITPIDVMSHVRSDLQLSVSAVGLPPGLSLNEQTGVISGTPTYDASSSYTATLTLTDKNDPSVSASVSIRFMVFDTVKEVINENETKTFELPLGYDFEITSPKPSWANIESGGLVLRPTINDGDGQTTVIQVVGTDREKTPQSSSSVSGTEKSALDIRTITRFYHIQVNDSHQLNVRPTASQIADKDLVAGRSFSYDFRPFFTDPDNNTLRYHIQFEVYNGPVDTINNGGNSNSGETIGGNVGGGTAGAVTLSGNSNTANTSHLQQAPSWLSVTNASLITENESNSAVSQASLASGAVVPNSDVAFITVDMPSGMSWSETNGVLSGRADLNQDNSYRVTVTAIEANTAERYSAESTFNISLESPIKISDISAKEAQEGVAISPINISRYVTKNPQNLSVSYSASGLPSGLSINTSTGVISGTPSLSSSGNKRVTITVRDRSDSSIHVSSSFNINVRNTNTVTVSEFQRSTIASGVGGNYTTANLQGAPSWVSLSSDMKTIILEPKEGVHRSEPYTFTLELVRPPNNSDGDLGERRRVLYHVEVKDAPEPAPDPAPNRRPEGTIQDKTITEGVGFNYNFATHFKDPDGDAVTYQLSFEKLSFDMGGGGGVINSSSVAASSASISSAQNEVITPNFTPYYVSVPMPHGLSVSSSGVLSGTAGYDTSGEYRVTATATEVSGEKKTGTAIFTLKINNGTPKVKPSVSIIGRSEIEKGKSYSITANAQDSDGRIISYEWKTSSGLSLSGSGREVSISGNSTSSQSVEVRVKDDDGLWSNWARKTITIQPEGQANNAPEAKHNLNAYGKVGTSFSYYIPDSAIVDQDSGDFLTYSAPMLPMGLTLTGNRIHGTPTNASKGNWTITATDSSGLSASVQINIEIIGDMINLGLEPWEIGGAGSKEVLQSLASASQLETVATPSLRMASTSQLETVAAPSLRMASTSQIKTVSAPSLRMASFAAFSHTPIAPPNLDTPLKVKATVQAKSAVPIGTARAKNSAKQYWFTYDNNNRVVIDGGSMDSVAGTIDIKSQGKYIEYNGTGQQTLVVDNLGKNAQQYIYDSWGMLAQVDGFLNKDGQDLYEQRAALSITHSNWRAQSSFEYDSLGQVTSNKSYYSIGSTAFKDVPVSPDRPRPPIGSDTEPTEFRYYVDISGHLKTMTENAYNLAGELERSVVKSLENEPATYIDDLFPANSYNGQRFMIYANNKWSESEFTVQSISEQYVYNVANRLDEYKYKQMKDLPTGVSDHLIHNFVKTYDEGRETYLETLTVGTGAQGHENSRYLQDTTTKSSYDANGNRTRVEEGPTEIVTGNANASADAIKSRYMRYGTEGKLLSKVTGTQSKAISDSDLITSGTSYDPYTDQAMDWESTIAQNIGFNEDKIGQSSAGSYFIYSNQQYLGELNKLGINTIKNQHFSAPNLNQSSAMTTHQVVAGDTLQSLAKRYFGSESLWYVIADANGVGAGAQLQAGTSLDIPSRANSFNSHDSFKPINLSEVIGDTTPSMPYVPPPPKAGCNVLASVIMIAVAVVATIATAGAA
ncbi:putative Ig domain-containing protein, partial [Pseudoalteromonas sp. SMS1]|uniref:putative Ig domain-containing protein n=1 Tax=Pseudoalteromonas sp. SMS1 TaxID=2908894 RepID=UPI001F1C5DF6